MKKDTSPESSSPNITTSHGKRMSKAAVKMSGQPCQIPLCERTSTKLVGFIRKCNKEEKVRVRIGKQEFDSPFYETKSKSIVMEEIEDTVSVPSFEMIVQWLHIGKEISATTGLARMAVMCQFYGGSIQAIATARIKSVIRRSAPQQPIHTSYDRTAYNTYHLTM
ncbi:hypothetical protein B0J14DRAFT_701587 [Halenospora varia]|nr:hypothetical protein B0J14DRAFT_701587 [Halenospora varia]